MAFQIPPQAFLSFSKKQAADSLWRVLSQMQQELSRGKSWKANAMAYESYVKVLRTHDSLELQELALELQKIPLNEPRDLESSLIFLERYLKKDLREDQFLISTEDTPLVKNSFPTHEREVVLVLDNLRSAFNVGSLFRSAEAFGVKTLHLCGYTASPENSKTAKAALGADHWVSYQAWDNTLDCLENLKEQGFTLYALETAQNATSLEDIKPSKKCALILGNERYGLAEPVLKRSDFLLTIPLIGRKNSLNVAVCGAISLHHFLKP